MDRMKKGCRSIINAVGKYVLMFFLFSLHVFVIGNLISNALLASQAATENKANESLLHFVVAVICFLILSGEILYQLLRFAAWFLGLFVNRNEWVIRVLCALWFMFGASLIFLFPDGFILWTPTALPAVWFTAIRPLRSTS